MTTMSISAMIIPGYDNLSEIEREAFERSASGPRLIELRENILRIQEELNKSSGLIQRVFGKANTKKQVCLFQLAELINEFHAAIAPTQEYQTLRVALTRNLLITEVGDFLLLNQEERFLLAQTEFSQKLFTSLTKIDKQIALDLEKKNNGWFWQYIDETEQTKLKAEREKEISIWKKRFQELPEMAHLREAIAVQKELMHKAERMRKFIQLQEHATQLTEFFPLLNYRKLTTEEPVVTQILAKYVLESGEVTAEPGKVDEELLADLLFHCIQQVCANEVDFLDLQAFNKELAKNMAAVVIKAFNEKATLDLDTWFKEYESQLHQYITEQLQLINGKSWQLSTASAENNLTNSLSYLWSNPVVDKANEFIRKMADAHSFIQATNFSARSDSSFLAILDIYNYARHQEQISEVRSILASLLNPLLPLYDEYKDIALYEKNSYWKSVRTIMPVLIVVATIILIAALLAPLVLPELAFAAAFIPALLLGLGLANKYVTIKNDLYKKVREWYYGGAFEIPEFQVNERMSSAFGTKEKAQKVRDFYIEELKKCDALESNYILKHEIGVLNQEDIELRKENRTKRQQLALEWYDIHSNKNLDYKQAPLIFLSRLKQKGDEEYVHLQTVLHAEDKSLRSSAAEVAIDVKATIISHNKSLSGEKSKETETTTIKGNYRNGLFSRPKALATKARMEELDQLREQITQAAV